MAPDPSRTDSHLASVAVETVLTYVVLAVVGVRLLTAARLALTGRGRATVVEVARRVRWSHVWPVPLVLTAVATVATLLLAVPGLDWGWWTAIGGQGNPIAGTTDRTTGTVWEWIIPLAFLLLVLPALPLFALAEERMFRQGAEQWAFTRRARKVLAFGLVHLIIGIPIAVALALSVGGVYFMNIYLRRFRSTGDPREAVMESTAAHATYNAFILTTGLVLVVLSAFGVA